MGDRGTIAWVVYRLQRVGGGQRLLLEGARYYRSLGYRVIIITWAFDESALFGGLYENKDIIEIGVDDIPRKHIFQAAWARARSLLRLRKYLLDQKVDTVFCQAEYDVALVYLATRLTRVRYRFLVFGQMFQYPHDVSKYSLVFRKHLAKIVNSCAGYRDTIPLKSPQLPIIDRLANEFISCVRFFAVRAAEKTFSFSEQVRWETEMLFGVSPEVAKGAFSAQLCTQEEFPKLLRSKYGLPDGKYILSLSRLEEKKRIGLIIRAYGRMGGHEHWLFIGGTGEYEEQLRHEAAQSVLAEKVRFIGRVDEEDMLSIKHGSALFVSMDIGDYDISPLEALAVGVPVICPPEFEVDENLSKVTGFQTCAADEHSLANEMGKILVNSPKPERHRLDCYSWERYFAALIS